MYLPYFCIHKKYSIMKYIIFGLFCLLSINSNGQKMNNANLVVNQLFIATDQQNWETVKACFSEKVKLDYSSMSGNPSAMLSPNEIVAAWKTILPGFTHTHHQLGNFMETQSANGVHVFCYGTASHYLESENGNIWTVVGSYDFDLEKQHGNWKITSMTFNFKYQEGNTKLAAQAMENVKSK